MREWREALVEQNNADICYIAMMADIELPDKEGIKDEEMVRQDKELLR